jgi:hypothetical protein
MYSHHHYCQGLHHHDDHLMVAYSLIDLRRGNGSGKESIDENLEDGCDEGTATSEEPIQNLGI